MPEITNRRVQVSRYATHTSIMLSWFEVGKEDLEDMQTKHISIDHPAILHKVEEIVNKMVDRWVHVFLSEGQMAIVSECVDKNSKRFDWVLDMAGNDESGFLLSIAEL